MWDSLKQVRFTAANEGVMEFKYDLNEKSFQRAQFRSTILTRGSISKADRCKYPEAVGIPAAKKPDLMKLCKKGHIPPIHHGFYEAMKIGSKAVDQTILAKQQKPKRKAAQRKKAV